jgi:hypothetical protein
MCCKSVCDAAGQRLEQYRGCLSVGHGLEGPLLSTVREASGAAVFKTSPLDLGDLKREYLASVMVVALTKEFHVRHTSAVPCGHLAPGRHLQKYVGDCGLTHTGVAWQCHLPH